jgi:hypothetical protein
MPTKKKPALRELPKIPKELLRLKPCSVNKPSLPSAPTHLPNIPIIKRYLIVVL